ncbi:MAG: GIY-YIG nuclease family protein [Patescibacteria group bacterium]
MFFVYAIYNSERHRVYIGQTEDLNRRIKEHNDSKNSRHTYTRRFAGEWVLIYKEIVETRGEAIRREEQLKSYRGRQFIKQYIPR